jgi:hypothetical protein
MPDYGELIGMTKEEREEWAGSATREELADCLVQAVRDEYLEYDKSELFDLLLKFTEEGTRGYRELTLEELRAELLQGLAEGDE